MQPAFTRALSSAAGCFAPLSRLLLPFSIPLGFFFFFSSSLAVAEGEEEEEEAAVEERR